MKNNVLIVPCIERGKGGGHLTRCMALVQDLRSLGKEASLFIPAGAKINFFFETVKFDQSLIVCETDLDKKKWELIILDSFQTPQTELKRWKEIAPVTGIDEGGSCRDNFDFLVDILVPEKFMCPPANISSPSLLKFPPKSNKNSVNSCHSKIKILITFGHEDSAKLGITAAQALSKKSGESMEITLLMGAMAKDETEYLANVQILKAIPNLSGHLCEYDLVITHYGITAYEALYAGTPVLLVNPSQYHEKLARAAGFKTFPIKLTQRHKGAISKKFVSFVSSCFNGKNLKEHCKTLAAKYEFDKEGITLAGFLNNFSPQVNRNCPVCSTNAPLRSIARFSDRTYRRCPHCGIIYMDRTFPPPIEYEKEYFFKSYRQQYGKTYLEDFPNLIKTAKKRLANVLSLMSPRKEKNKDPLQLLDIGCAYGPFLAASRDAGFVPFGIDPAQDAVNYVKNELGIPAVQGFFPDCPLPVPEYDVVTLWYVIEHFLDFKSALAAIKKILKPGGILAFSTPSYSGISGSSSLYSFLLKSPGDHRTIWSPKMCRKTLAHLGFNVKKIVISGCHPQRFPFFGQFAKNKKSPMYWLLLAAGKLFMLGDTFEVYAEVK